MGGRGRSCDVPDWDWSSTKTAIEEAVERGDWKAVAGLAARAVSSGEQARVAETVSALTGPAITAGNTTAMVVAAVALQEQDFGRAVALTRSAANQGSRVAMAQLSRFLRSDAPVEALEWESKAADRGERNSLSRRGARHIADPDPSAALRDLTWAAGLGDRRAMDILGWFYLELDADRSRAWFTKAADAGSAWAAYMLGVFVLRPWEWPEKIRLLTRAADAGQTGAMLPLASLINPDDPDRAWAWVRRAAEDGDAAARKIVGAGRPRWRWPGWVQRPPRSILGTSYWLLERATLNPWRVTANRSRLGLAYLRIQNPAGLQPHLAALREELYKGERVKAISAARLPGDPKTVIVGCHRSTAPRSVPRKEAPQDRSLLPVR
jgi:TPR repeat protein